METIKPDPLNYRHHSTKNQKLIRKSLKECGAGRSILIDADDTVVAGNGVFEQANKLGIKTRTIETDGSELIVVKRTDIKMDDRKRKQLALADNATSDTSDWDMEALRADWNADELSDWGLKGKFEEDEDNPYTMKTDIPQYSPTGKTVVISDLLDTSKYTELVMEIDRAKIPEDVKEMLRIAATRHIVFDYRNMAEYYAQAKPEIQRLMEQSALVLIDINDAIKNGYVELSAELEKIFEEDYKNANQK